MLTISKRLVCLTKEEREKIQEKYKDKVPEPLTSQFLEKTPKNEATRSEKRKLQNYFQQVNVNPKLNL